MEKKELMAESSGRRPSRKVDDDDTPSFLRKTIAAAVRGNEARQKWKQLERSAKSSLANVEEDASPRSRPRANSVFQIMAPSQLKPRLSMVETDEAKRRCIRTLGSSSAAFETHSMKDVVERVPLYNGCSSRFLEALAPMVHSRLVEAGTDIVVEGEVGDCMYILSRGDAELFKGDEMVEKTEDGAVFGEYSSISKLPALTTRPWTVRATSLCDVKMLQRDDVLQVLSHFRDDANLLKKRIELYVESLQKKGAMPAKKEWWQIRRHSAASNTSACSDKVGNKTEGTAGFPSAVGRALTGIKLARRFSVGGGALPTSQTTTLPIFGGPVQRRRMSDSMLVANLSERMAQRQSSKSSQVSMQSIQERDGADSASASSSSSSSSSEVPLPMSPQRSEEPVDSVDFQASHSIRILQAEAENETVAVAPVSGGASEDLHGSMAKRLVHDLLVQEEEEVSLRTFSPVSPASAGTVKFEDLGAEELSNKEISTPPAPPAPSLPSIQRSLHVHGSSVDDGSPVQDSPSGPSLPNAEMATIKLPAATRLLTVEEHRQRDVALHPLNQGGLCGGFPVCASQRGIKLAHMAALRVCRKAPINGAAARHQQLIGQMPKGRVWQPTVASKCRNWRRSKVDRIVARVVVVAKVPEASETPMTLWQEFQSKRAAGIVCSR